jgi:ABC-type multidrug transport system ATPase subunit
VDFSVEPGEIFGFLGPKGAGKTTNIRILTGFIRAGSGQATVLGMDALVNGLVPWRGEGRSSKWGSSQGRPDGN